jgi:Ca-activated chloride channel family protein
LGGELRTLSQRRAKWITALQLALMLMALACLVVGLARPRIPDRGTRMPTESLALQTLLDVSGSMNEKDLVWENAPQQRLSVAKLLLHQFLLGDEASFLGRRDDLLGILTFAVRIEDVCPPTLSHDAVRYLLVHAEPIGTPPDSGTNVGDAILQGIELLRNVRAPEKVLLLVTDGDHNVPAEVMQGAFTPRQAAQVAQALGIRIYAIHVGGQPKQETNGQNGDATATGLQTLREITERTQGRCYAATNGADVLGALRAIDDLERTRLESERYYRYLELYPWLGVCALACIGLRALLERGRWSRLL